MVNQVDVIRVMLPRAETYVIIFSNINIVDKSALELLRITNLVIFFLVSAMMTQIKILDINFPRLE